MQLSKTQTGVRDHHPDAEGFIQGKRPLYPFNKVGDPNEYYGKMEMENMPEEGDIDSVEPGEYVEICLEDAILTEDGQDHHWVMEVEAMYRDPGGEYWVTGRWFWSAIDTFLRVEEAGTGPQKGKQICRLMHHLDGRRLFRSTKACTRDTLILDSINRKVTVRQVMPGQDPPGLGECDFYWNLEHDEHFSTFSMPPQQEGLAQQPDQQQQQQQQHPQQQQPKHSCSSRPRKRWKGMDLFAGGGGVAHLADSCTSLYMQYAVDHDRDACATYAVNFPETMVTVSDIDEYVWRSRLFEKLVKARDRGQDLTLMDSKAAAEASSSLAFSLGPDGQLLRRKPKFQGEQRRKRGDWPVESIGNVHLGTLFEPGDKMRKRKGKGVPEAEKDPEEEPKQAVRILSQDNCFLLFEVYYEGEPIPDLFPLSKLEGCMELLLERVDQLRAERRIPIPGHVQFIVGGPPCQGISGLNRVALGSDIFTCPRNRQLLVFIEAVKFFCPDYVLMENVPSCLLVDSGVYAKYVQTELLNMGMQTSLGLVNAAHHGAPQDRWRVFIWGAKPHCKLPAFPQPVHTASKHTRPPGSGRAHLCVVDFESSDRARQAFPKVVMGDILDDLPEINNFTVSEHADYSSPPSNPLQAYLRQGTSPQGRARHQQKWVEADRVTKPTTESYAAAAQNRAKEGGPLEVGRAYGYRKGSTTLPHLQLKEDAAGEQGAEGDFREQDAEVEFATATWKASVKALGTIVERDCRANMQASLTAVNHEAGNKVLQEFEKAAHAQGPLRDHRTFCMGHADCERIGCIPIKEGAGFSSLPGVYHHDSEGAGRSGCCAGHSHQPQITDKHGMTSCACPAGGTYAKKAKIKGKPSGERSSILKLDANGWRGSYLEGCPSRTHWLRCGELACPRWCISKSPGEMNDGGMPFGRIVQSQVLRTVNTRMYELGATCLHPSQPRVLTIREVARAQGFPDHHTFVGTIPGLTGDKQRNAKRAVVQSWAVSAALKSRYQQVGNAVSPLVAAALGHCLEHAIQGNSPMHVMDDSPYVQGIRRASEGGLQFWCQKHSCKGAFKPAGANPQPMTGEDIQLNLDRDKGSSTLGLPPGTVILGSDSDIGGDIVDLSSDSSNETARLHKTHLKAPHHVLCSRSLSFKIMRSLLDGLELYGRFIKDNDSNTYYKKIKMPNMPEKNDVDTIEPGDHLEICTDILAEDGSEHHWVMHVHELYQDIKKTFWILGQWFWSPKDTSLGVATPVESAEGLRDLTVHQLLYDLDEGDERQLFRSTEALAEPQPLGSVHRKVQVQQLAPDQPIPGPDKCDYFWIFEHDEKFSRFMTPSDCVGPQQQQQQLLGLHLYCGAGGMAYIAETCEGLILQWAVDSNIDGCLTYGVNFHDTVVTCSDVEKFLIMSKLWQKVLEARDADRDLTAIRVSKTVAEVLSSCEYSIGRDGQLSPTLPAFTGPEKDAKGDEYCQVVRMGNVHLGTIYDAEIRKRKLPEDELKDQQASGRALSEDTCFLLFECYYENEPVPDVFPLCKLAQCQDMLLKRVDELRAEKRIPVPGDVHFIMGGPPCQGMSGLNRRAPNTDIFSCTKNHQLLVFLEAVRWFDPDYTMMENVPNCLTRARGAYAKYAQTALLKLGMQTCYGLINAAHQGDPQTRWRMIMCAAKPGRQLPAFPSPVHWHNKRMLPPALHQFRLCVVDFPSPKLEHQAFPPVLVGDILRDLPKVGNFTLCERVEYAGPPVSPTQFYLRQGLSSLKGAQRHEVRGKAAERHMQPTWDAYAARARSVEKEGGPLEVGKAYGYNRGRSTLPLLAPRKQQRRPAKADDADEAQQAEASFAVETFYANVEAMAKLHRMDLSACERNARADIENGLNSISLSTGTQVLQELQDAALAQGPLRNHRPMCYGHADNERMELIPMQKGAGFSSLPGVHRHEPDASGHSGCCCGHSHQPWAMDKQGKKRSVCPGGGTYRWKSGRASILKHDAGGWRGARLSGCPSDARLLACGEWACPRWVISKNPRTIHSGSMPYGRISHDEVMGTVNTKMCVLAAGFSCLHPEQHRVLSIREVARAQGFPDTHIFVGTVPGLSDSTEENAQQPPFRSWANSKAQRSCYIQIGNAVSPLVAAALGSCLDLAIQGRSPPGKPVIWLENTPYIRAIQQARDIGLEFEWEKRQGTSARGAPVTAYQSALQDDNPSLDQQRQSSPGFSPFDLIIMDSESGSDDDVIDMIDDNDEP
ncbi:hypothetical protein WJX74_009535 [Apatococcus lobatus]|uniref:DNA (cytosine-5-)-methyltransferase n=1 Tax=Apatococcus lobatus TaxID=904363 RepID=A0AAW1RTL6_9CHLO